MAVTVTSSRNKGSLTPSFREAAAPVRATRLERFANLVAAVDNVQPAVFQAAVEIVSGFHPKAHAAEAWDFLQTLAESDTKEFVEDDAEQVGESDTNVGEDDTPFNDDEPYSTNKKARRKTAVDWEALGVDPNKATSPNLTPEEIEQAERDRLGDDDYSEIYEDIPYHKASADDDEWEKPWEKDEDSDDDSDDDDSDDDSKKNSSLRQASYSYAIEAGYDNSDAGQFADWNTSTDFDSAMNSFWEKDSSTKTAFDGTLDPILPQFSWNGGDLDWYGFTAYVDDEGFWQVQGDWGVAAEGDESSEEAAKAAVERYLSNQVRT